MIEFKNLSEKGSRFVRSVSAVFLALLLLILLVGCVEGIYTPYTMDPQEDLSAPGQSESVTDGKLAGDGTALSTETPALTTASPPEQTQPSDAATTDAASATASTSAAPSATSAVSSEAALPSVTETPTAEPTAAQPAAIDEEGYYYSKDDVALYIHTYGHLPPNFITKKEATEMGWKGGSLEKYAEGCAIGGDRFGNREGLLPKQKGRVYTECDIDTKGKKSRGAKRIVFSNDGLIFYTDDHYDSFTQLYP